MLKNKIVGAITAVCLLACSAAGSVYAYDKPAAVQLGESVSVYGGAAYVMSFDAVNNSDTAATVYVKNENGENIGQASVKPTSGTVRAYSAPMKAERGNAAKTRLYFELDENADSSKVSVSDIKLSLCSEDVIRQEQKDGALSVYGNVDARTGGMLKLYVLDNAEEYEFNDDSRVVYSCDVSVERAGSYEVNVDTSKIDKYYSDLTAVIYGLDALGFENDAAAIDFRYTKTALKAEVLEKLRNADSADTVKSIVEGGSAEFNNIQLLGLDSLEILDRFADKEFLYEFLYKNKAEIDEQKVLALAATACAINAFSSGDLTSDEICSFIEKHEDILGLTEPEYTPYTTAYKAQPSEIKKAVAAAMKHTKDIKNSKAFKNEFANAALHTVIGNAANYTAAIKYLSDNAKYLGLKDPAGLSESKQKQLADYAKNTDDVMTIKTKESELRESKDDNGGSPGGSSGGSGSGKGGSGGSSGGGSSSQLLYGISGKNNTPAENQQDIVFSDVSKNDWSYPYINGLVKEGVISGYSDGSFRPGQSITRAEFTKLAAEAFGLRSDLPGMSFSDVGDDEWCHKYISTLSALGIINGIGDGSFGKENNISRQDMAVIICKIARYLGADLAEYTPEFSDSEEISGYALSAVGSMIKMGIISGTDGNMFMPNGTATREQAAKVIYMLKKALEK